MKKFPGALLDASGYIVFETEEDYQHCSYLHLGVETSCPKGISSIPGYIHVGSPEGKASDLAEPQKAQRALSVSNRIIRDSPLARQLKHLYGNECQICGLTLTMFGGQSYAEAHHIQPLGSDHHGPDFEGNIICVCPNCHAQLDYGAIELNQSNLRIHPKHKLNDENVEYHNSQIFRGASKK